MTINEDGGVATYERDSWSKAEITFASQLTLNSNQQSISCVSSSFCMGVSGTGRANTYNGSEWASDNGTPLGSGSFGDISCSSASFCAAVHRAGNALEYSNGVWSQPRSVDPGQELAAVSCASSSFCAAADEEGNALTYNGSAWSTPVNIESLAFDAISCVSSSFCVAADRSGNVVTYNGSSWGRPEHVDTTAIFSISCALTTFCAAVDAEGRGLTFNGKTWSTPHSDGSSDSSSFYAVSCPYSSYCVATGSRINPTGDYDYGEGIDLIYNNGSWGSLGAVTEDQPELGDQPESVSCASATFCVAANFGSVLTYNGETWSDADTSTLAHAQRNRPPLPDLLPHDLLLRDDRKHRRRAHVHRRRAERAREHFATDDQRHSG